MLFQRVKGIALSLELSSHFIGMSFQPFCEELHLLAFRRFSHDSERFDVTLAIREAHDVHALFQYARDERAIRFVHMREQVNAVTRIAAVKIERIVGGDECDVGVEAFLMAHRDKLLAEQLGMKGSLKDEAFTGQIAQRNAFPACEL